MIAFTLNTLNAKEPCGKKLLHHTEKGWYEVFIIKDYLLAKGLKEIRIAL